jgi:hypothetical protein
VPVGRDDRGGGRGGDVRDGGDDGGVCAMQLWPYPLVYQSSKAFFCCDDIQQRQIQRNEVSLEEEERAVERRRVGGSEKGRQARYEECRRTMLGCFEMSCLDAWEGC